MHVSEQLRQFLSQFLNGQHYRGAIANARERMARDPRCALSWQAIRECVQQRALREGEALELVNVAANQVLDANSDDEAYAWLDLMIENIDSAAASIREY